MMELSAALSTREDHRAADTMLINKAELWPCVVEQGLVALLETISVGNGCFVIPEYDLGGDVSMRNGKSIVDAECNDDVHKSDRNMESNLVHFPEEHIKILALSLINSVIAMLIGHENVKTRLFGAMLHSGNTKLRINIITGFIFLSGRSAELGR